MAAELVAAAEAAIGDVLAAPLPTPAVLVLGPAVAADSSLVTVPGPAIAVRFCEAAVPTSAPDAEAAAGVGASVEVEVCATPVGELVVSAEFDVIAVFSGSTTAATSGGNVCVSKCGSQK